MTKPIEFYFDLATPYGFLAAMWIDALPSPITWRPFLLGAVYKTFGQSPLDHPLKRDYVTPFKYGALSRGRRRQQPFNDVRSPPSCGHDRQPQDCPLACGYDVRYVGKADVGAWNPDRWPRMAKPLRRRVMLLSKVGPA